MTYTKIISIPQPLPGTFLFNEKEVVPVYVYPLYALLPGHASLINALLPQPDYRLMIERSREHLLSGVLDSSPFTFFERWNFGISLLSHKKIGEILPQDILGHNIMINEVPAPGDRYKDIFIDHCYADPFGKKDTEAPYEGVALFTIAQACDYFFRFYPDSAPRKIALRLKASPYAYELGTFHCFGFVDAPTSQQSKYSEDILMYLYVHEAWRFLRRYRSFIGEKMKEYTAARFR